MKIAVHLLIMLLVLALLIASGISLVEVANEKARITSDLQGRSIVFSETLQESVRPWLRPSGRPHLLKLLNQLERRANLFGIAVCDPSGKLLAAAPGPLAYTLIPPSIKSLLTGSIAQFRIDKLDGRRF